MKRPRSPKFPAVPLRKALRFAAKLKSTTQPPSFTPKQAAEALEFSSLHGRAVKVFAALRAYGLIERQKESGEEKIFKLSSSALKMIKNEFSAPGVLKELQYAALSPLLFRQLFKNARSDSEEQLIALLQNRGFTEGGATRAAKVFRQNFEFAKLEELHELPEGLPARGPAQNAPQQKRKAIGQGLSLPLSSGVAYIPSGLSEEEHQLVVRTLNLWKDRLISTAV